MPRLLARLLSAFMLCGLAATTSAQTPLVASDLFRLRSVGDVAFSPDAAKIAYSVSSNPTEGRPFSQLWIMDVASGRATRVGDEQSRGSSPVWSPDGTRIAFEGRVGAAGQSGLIVVRADGTGAEFIARMQGTNSAAITMEGDAVAWSPDGRRIAFVHATPGPETADADGDPKVITRYLYKPTASEGNTRFNDNRRLHIFVADVATKQVRQLTDGIYSEHSIDWSPTSDEIVFISNREPDPDFVFNNDVFAVKVSDGSVRRITATESAEYRPRWSPDGRTLAYQATRRGITDLETAMEDTHVWVMNADGTDRRDIGASIDNRQGAPQWSRDGASVYTTVQEHGHVRLYRLNVTGGPGVLVVGEAGTVGSFSLGRAGQLAYAYSSPTDLPQIYLRSTQGAPAPRALTDLNGDVLRSKAIAPMESFTFVSNDLKHEVEAWLVKPVGLTSSSSHPLIVNIHGGPHGVQGQAFNVQNQVYAGRGWAVLMVNYRGSIGYGQAWADGVFRDQNGDEAQDVLYGVNAALRRYTWIDRNRLGVEGGSYGGQLSAWLVTVTNIFKAAIPRWPIINLVSYNYMTYYPMYEEMEFGAKVHTADWLDQLWRRSSIRYVNGVKTPTMLMHGENDNDVPIAESEQFYMGLKDAGVETVMVRYPREGHGLREPTHTVDMITRSIAWYKRHFQK